MILRRPRSLALSLTLSMASAPSVALAQTSPTAAPAAASAPTEIAAGDKAARAKDWAGALTHYQAAQAATPSWRAQLGVADALYQQGRLGEAYEQYDDAQKTYGTKYGAGEKGLVNARLKDLTAKTGWISIRVGEAGAEVTLDGKSIGVSPVPALIRVGLGSHEVHVTKAGFAAYTSRAEVAADGKAVLEVALTAQPTTGHIVVHSAGTDVLRVTLDGVDVGSTPWEGDVPPGSHQIAGRTSAANASPQTVDVPLGGRVAVDLAAASTVAHVQVRTNDGKGNIYVDGVIKGEGAFAGDVPSGAHTIVVSREGYERFEKTVTLGSNETSADTVTLKPLGAAGGKTEAAERRYEGLYGGFGALLMLSPGSEGTELDTNCGTLGATSCDTSKPIGGGGFVYLGWTWDPVGFEVMLGGGGDAMQQKANFTGVAPSGSSLPISTPARLETFDDIRFGGLAALRARASFQTGWIRGTFAGGVGFSYKELVTKRDVIPADGTSAPSAVPDPVGYYSPALTLEAAAQFRVSQTISISAGVEMWAESASIAGKNGGNAGPLQPVPTAQPVAAQAHFYHEATGPQVMIGPFVGMQFGP